MDSHVCGTLEISVPAQAASLARVRLQLRVFLTEHDVREDQRHGAVLVTHELAANAIAHGSAGEGDVISITLRIEPQSLLIRVLDPARTEAVPASLEANDWRESGRGMLIVDQLATWNEELVDDHREVTAELPLVP